MHIFNHPKINLISIFALNFGTLWLFEFLILIEGVRNDEGSKVIAYNF
jgi:hypothetical protein